MSLIPITQAKEELGYKSTCIFYDKKAGIQKYVVRKHGSKRDDLMFDIKAYIKHEELKESFTEKVKLFIEYLKHEENMSYKEISEISKVNLQQLYNFEFGFDYTYKVARAFSNNRPYLIKRFDEYYGWNYKKSIRNIVFKV